MSSASARKWTGVVFDLDGTLIDSYEAITDSLNHALDRLGHPPVSVDQVRPMVGRGLEVLVERALTRAGESDPVAMVPDAVRHFRQNYDLICVEKTRLLPGVEETLSDLHRRGYAMSVATNKPSYFSQKLLDALGVGRFLTSVWGPDRVTHPKPHPGMVEAALASMRVSRDQAVYVGDMEIDVETARAAGLPVIVMPTGSCSMDQLRQAGADHVVAGFTSLLDLLADPCPAR